MNTLKAYVFSKLFILKVPELDLSKEAIKEFDEIYNHSILDGQGESITYKSKYPKYLFLNYLIENKNVLVHGSNHPDITSFEPRDQTLFNGKPVKAVFAASDAVWSLYFAVINRNEYKGSLRNMCLTVPTKKGIQRFYYFSVNKDYKGECWTNGTMYILPKNSFQKGGIKDEWISETHVTPLAKIQVSPEDFPFLKKVSKHDEKDSAMKSIGKALFIKK